MQPMKRRSQQEVSEKSHAAEKAELLEELARLREVSPLKHRTRSDWRKKCGNRAKNIKKFKKATCETRNG